MTVDFSRLVGNEAIKTVLSQKIASGNLAHAYLICGAAGSGKKTLAFLLSAAIACKNGEGVPCLTCAACRKILSAQSPDLITLGVGTLPLLPHDIASRTADVAPDKPEEAPRSIGVDVIRALREEMYILPNDMDRKIYLIDHAERLTEQAQNALLKLLEEPPQSVLFLMLCEDPSALLSTVRSRVQTLQMEYLSDEVLRDYITKTSTAAKTLATRDEDKLRLLIRLSNGCIGTLKYYLGATGAALRSNAHYEAHKTAMSCMSIVFAKEHSQTASVLGGDSVLPRKTALYELLTARASSREALRALLDALMTAVRDLLCCCYVTQEECVRPLFFINVEQPLALACEVAPSDVMYVAETLAAYRSDLDYNPNAPLLLIQIADTLMRLRFR